MISIINMGIDDKIGFKLTSSKSLDVELEEMITFLKNKLKSVNSYSLLLDVSVLSSLDVFYTTLKLSEKLSESKDSIEKIYLVVNKDWKDYLEQTEVQILKDFNLEFVEE